MQYPTFYAQKNETLGSVEADWGDRPMEVVTGVRGLVVESERVGG